MGQQSFDRYEPIRVLFVEDDEDDFIIVRDLLTQSQRQAFRLDWESDYEEGIAAISRREHDVILLDYRLGSRSGIELLEEAIASGCSTPIIFLTGFGDDDTDLRAMSAGAADYLVKARLDAELLRRTIRHALERSRALDELMSARDAAAQATLIKSQFLANMSHEIRTPMNAIIGMTGLALGADLTPELREYLETVQSSADSLLTLVNDILDISKIEAGRMELESVPFSLREVISEPVRVLSTTAAAKGLSFTNRVPLDLPDVVVGDPGRLKQVLTNLLSNAIKFTDHGYVELRVELDGRLEDAATFHFQVEDTGIGIPLDVQQSVFDPFEQADTATTRRYGGSGLGLAISSEIAERMGGRIWVDSVEGQGSTFHFTASLGAVPDDEIQAPLGTPRGTDEPIIVLASNGAQRTKLTTTLQHGGFAPMEVEDVSLAVAVASYTSDVGAAPRAVVVQADKDGFDICRRYLTEEALSTPVVIIASSGERGDAARCREIGIAGYLAMPVDPSEVIDAVHAVIALADMGDQSTLVTRHWLREHRPVYRVLIVDDSPTNLRLALRILQQRGHEAVTVVSGQDAIQAVKEQEFHLVLMDVQMPEMDGYEATAALRIEEASTGRFLPIVAMTANAMAGDREKCLAAGMDDYIPKPFKLEEFVTVTEQWAAKADRVIRHSPAPELPIFDHAEALEKTGGMSDILTEMAGVFLEELQELTAAIEEALADNDLLAVAAAAHRLKGNLGQLAAHPAREATLELEHAAKSGTDEQVQGAWNSLKLEMQRLQPKLLTLAKGDSI